MKGVGPTDDGKKHVQILDIFHFIYKKDVSRDKKIIYTQLCCDIRLQKDKINRTQLTIGGDILDCDGITSIETTGLKTINIHLNSTISIEGTKYEATGIGTSIQTQNNKTHQNSCKST